MMKDPSSHQEFNLNVESSKTEQTFCFSLLCLFLLPSSPTSSHPQPPKLTWALHEKSLSLVSNQLVRVQ